MKSKTFLTKAWRENTREYTPQGGHKTIGTREEWNKKFFQHPRGGMFTTNGFVAHIDHSYECEFEEWGRPDLESFIKGNLLALVEVSKEHFLRACKAARSVRPTFLNIHANGAMEVSAENDEIGRAYCAIANKHPWKIKGEIVPVHYQKAGEDKRFLVDPMYLINALQGMDDVLTMEVYEYMIVLRSETRAAIIMMMMEA